MEQVCVHCGKAFATDDASAAGTIACPFCGKPTPIGAPAAAATVATARSRFKTSDVLIILAVLALLAALVLLFLKPKQPARDLVFGDLGLPTPTNTVVTNNVVTNITTPATPAPTTSVAQAPSPAPATGPTNGESAAAAAPGMNTTPPEQGAGVANPVPTPTTGNTAGSAGSTPPPVVAFSDTTTPPESSVSGRTADLVVKDSTVIAPQGPARTSDLLTANAGGTSASGVGVGVGAYVSAAAMPAHIGIFAGRRALTNGQATAVNFGSILQNFTGRTATFTISNNGGQALDLGAVTVPPGFILTKAPPAIIDARDIGTFNVRLDSSVVGTNFGLVTVANSDPTNNPFSFSVSGVVASPPPPPQLEVLNGDNPIASGQTKAVNFGAIGQGLTGPVITFTVTNAGGQALDLKSVSLPPGYSLAQPSPGEISPAGQGTFAVQLNSDTPGTYSGDITITNNGATNNPFSIPVTGTVTISPTPVPASTNGVRTSDLIPTPNPTPTPTPSPQSGAPGTGTGTGTGTGNGTGNGNGEGAGGGNGNGAGSGSGNGAGGGSSAANGANPLPSPTAAASPTPPPPQDDGHGYVGMMTNEDLTRVFNSSGPANNVVFILDHSLSMKSHGKSTAARRELLNALETMGPAHKFYVMFFHSGGYEAMPTPTGGPVDATPDNIRAMTNWLFSTGHKFGSDPTKAVQHALQLLPPPDTLWLLSDGKFSTKAAVAIRDANVSLNAHINTIGFYSREGEQVLRQIAGENRGIYHFVPPPNATAANTP